MPTTPKLKRLALPLIATLAVLTACAHKQPKPPASGVTPSAIPPLPQTAKQPRPPSLCVPTCSDGLTALRQSWPPMPTPPARPASSASAPINR